MFIADGPKRDRWPSVRAIAIGLALLLASSCDRMSGNSAEVLWIPAGAAIRPDALDPLLIVNGRSVYSDGSISAAFITSIEPAEVTRQVVQHFAALGWRQRASQYVNPAMPTSFGAGWLHQCACILQLGPDGRPIPHSSMESWRGEWENHLGDVIAYSMTSQDATVEVYTEYIPARLVLIGQRLGKD